MAKNPFAHAEDTRDMCSIPGRRKVPWGRKWQFTLPFLPGKPHRQVSLAGYSPWGRKESDTTEHSQTLKKGNF